MTVDLTKGFGLNVVDVDELRAKAINELGNPVLWGERLKELRTLVLADRSDRVQKSITSTVQYMAWVIREFLVEEGFTHEQLHDENFVRWHIISVSDRTQCKAFSVLTRMYDLSPRIFLTECQDLCLDFLEFQVNYITTTPALTAEEVAHV